MVAEKLFRIMAIDYGLKRVGIAVTDPLQIIAIPLTTVSSHALFFFLKQYLQKEIVSIFVMGMPQGLDGKPSAMSRVMERVGAKLKNAFPQQSVCYQDERFTSTLAAQGLHQAGYSKKDRQNKANIDKVSAAILLQSYLRSLEHLAIRPLSKLVSGRQMLGAHGAENRSVSDIHEDLSTGATTQLSVEVEF